MDDKTTIDWVCGAAKTLVERDDLNWEGALQASIGVAVVSECGTKPIRAKDLSDYIDSTKH